MAELLGDRELELWGAVIKLAIEDIEKPEPQYPEIKSPLNLKKYESAYNSWRNNKFSALQFFKGGEFKTICGWTGLRRNEFLQKIGVRG